MTKISDIQKQILESDNFVLSETKKIQYTYGLKHETRYIVDRNEEVDSESVAEHVYGLHVLADYFLPIEDTEHTMDWMKVHQMVQYHDIDEIETGDKIGYLKTDEDRAKEAQAAKRVIQNFPSHLQQNLETTLEEYEAQESKEAIFTKAIDRIEPLFQLYNQNGKKILEIQQTTKEQSISLKDSFIRPFPYMYRFFEVIETTMEKEGFFH